LKSKILCSPTPIPRHYLISNCKMLDLRFQALPDEITACHSSLGGEFGEGIDVVKDAQHRLRRRSHSPSPATDALLARVLDNLESPSPIMLAVE
jgi:hypothetical protein